MESVKNTATVTDAPIANGIDETQATSSARKEFAKEERKRSFKSHLRCSILEIINFLFNHDWTFWLIGLVNKKVNLIESVFLVYPANEKYALAYAYASRLRRNIWQPWLTGIMKQNGGIGIMFAISANNGQFSNSQNADNLKKMSERMERLRKLLRAKRKTFAGILPGILFLRRIIREAPEADLTATAVVKAIENVKIQELLGSDTPVIVLGGKGFIGRRVIKSLNGNTYSIDIVDCQDSDTWPAHLSGKPAIVVNITLNNAIRGYIEDLWPGVVVINEVYPEPSQDILKRLREKGCNCYHIVGIEASAFPPFPAAYKGAIPCCAAWPSPEMKVVVRKIN